MAVASPAAPLNITLSIGDVSFHLTPSANNDPSLSSPTQTRSASPYATHKKRHQLRRSGLVRANSISQQQQLNSPSQPIVAIRHGPSYQSTPPAGPTSPQSPLQQNILGRVRSMKDKIETQDGTSISGAAASQSPLFSSSNTADDYCVDLNSFTGTLHITSFRNNVDPPPPTHNNNSRTQNKQSLNLNSSREQKQRGKVTMNSPPKPTFKHLDSMSMHSPSQRKRTADNDNNNVKDSIKLSKRRSKSSSFTWISSNENEEVEMGRVSDANDDKGLATVSHVVNDSEEKSIQFSMHVTGNNEQEDEQRNGSSENNVLSAKQQKTGDAKKSVRFSTLSQNHVINPPLKKEDLSDGSLARTISTDAIPKFSSDEENVQPNDAAMQSPQSNDASVHFSMVGQHDDPPKKEDGTTTNYSAPHNMNQNSLKSPHPNISNSSQTTTGQSPQLVMQQPHQSRSKHFFSSPQTTFSSPPRAAKATAKASMDIARETSALLARSSKHVLKQITLAGGDAVASVYDVLHGDGVGSSNNSSRSRSAFLDPNHGHNNDVYDAFDGSELHYACASDSLDHLRCLIEYDSLEDLHTSDCDGKLPIHVLVENHRLINEDPLGCEEVAFALIELMQPEKAVQALHPCGLAPFVYIIGTWTENIHQEATARKVGSVAARSAAKTPRESQSDEENRQSATLPSSNSPQQPRKRRVTYRSLFNSSTRGDRSTLVSSTDRAKMLYIPPTSVPMPDHVRWAIRILSRLIDEYPEQTREAILTNIASVPLFLKSLLLIPDIDELSSLLDETLVKHCVLDKRNIEIWLCAMLTDTKQVKLRAVTFLKLISRLTLQDLAATSESPDRYSSEEIKRFQTLREDTFNAVYVMPGIVPAVLELGGQMIENLSTTRVMRYLTDRTIRKESVFFVLILDFFYSVFLLMGYRLNVEFVLNYQNVNGPAFYREYSYISSSTMGVAGYFLVKEAMTLLSLYLTSTKLAKRYCSSIFNIIDVASVAMLLGTESALTSDPTLLDNEGFAASLTIILLWLKLFGAFKILNSAFSLFLYAVNEVIKEVKWFLLFLFGVTLMFSDAARTIVAARGDCQYNVDGNQYVAEEFCSDHLLAVIIRMYSVLVGDVALEYFTSSDAMVAVFAFFSFFSIIILLNVLIAIIIDSFEGSKRRSREIFYRARIEYAAHLVARKQFLKPKERSDFHVATYVPQKARQAMRIVYFLVQAIALVSVEYGFAGAVYFLTLDSKYDYRMIRSLMIIYVCVGAIFNVYVLSVAAIALFSRYEKRFNGLVWPAEPQHTALYDIIKNTVQFLEMAVKLYHGLLGFNADRTVEDVDVSEEFLIAGAEEI